MMAIRDVDRRAFLAFAIALAAFLGRADESPSFRIGFLTDTHVGRTKKSCERVKGALKVFRDLDCRAVVHCGDLADWHYEEGYRFYLEEVEEIFPLVMKDRPQFLYVFGNHDALDPKRMDPKLRATRQMDHAVAFGDMCRRIKIDHGFFVQREIDGSPILVFPQTMSDAGGYAFFEEKVARACADHPGRPVFVCTHPPSKDTCYNSGSWGDGRIRKILDKYPQVVQFSGHTHGSLRNELSIWQGSFTAVDVCCLQEWHGITAGTPLTGKQAYGVVVAEVYPTRIVIRRFDVRDGSEIHPDARWVVPWPLDPKNAPLSVASRRGKACPGRFAAGSEITCVPDAVPFSKVKVSFPAVTNEEDVCLYRVKIARKGAKAGWEDFACCEIFSEFHRRPHDRTGVLAHEFSCAYFDSIADYRLTVTPIGFFGTPGAPIETVWRAPAGKSGKVVWACENPMEELDFRCGWPRNDAEMRQAKNVPSEDGWYHPQTQSWLMLKEGVWNLPKGTKFRLVAEMGLEQDPDKEGWNLYLKVNDSTSRSISGGWMLTPGGRTDVFRYVVESTVKTPGLDYAITFANGNGGRVRFNNVRLEVLE